MLTEQETFFINTPAFLFPFRAIPRLAAAAAALLLFGTPLAAQNPLPTGKDIALPPLGTQTDVGSLPMNMILTPNGKFVVVSDMGYHELLTVLDAATGKQVSSIDFGSPLTHSKSGLYYGLAAALNADGTQTLYASQGGDHTVAVFQISAAGQLFRTGSIVMQAGDFPAGVALDHRGYLYVAVNQSYEDNLSDATTPGSLVVYNTAAPGVVKSLAPEAEDDSDSLPAPETDRYRFGTLPTATNPAGTPTNYPYAVAALSGGGRVYVTSQRDDAVFVFDMTRPETPALIKTLKLGAASGPKAHPIALLLNKSQSRLYIAYAGGDAVAAVDTARDTIISRTSLRPSAAAALPGVTPTGLGLSRDESRLYVTLGDMNAIGVLSAYSNKLLGYIPAGWYPTAVVASPLKPVLLIADAKGTVPRHPNPGYVYSKFGGDPNYGQYLIIGNVSAVPIPSASQLAAQTQRTLRNNRIAPALPNPLLSLSRRAGKIKHIIYIIKENRTYDQVLGDLPAGNGDAKLAIFGKSVTPNQHALATRFVLLDNFFDCAEVSGDGWPWSTQGLANEAVIKDLPYNYSQRGRNYDFEGSNNNYPVGGFPATDPYGNPLVGKDSPFYDKAAPPIADVSEAPGGHLWDDAKRAGLTYRNYGYFTSFGVGPKTDLLLPENYPGSAGLQPVGMIPTTLRGAAASLRKAGVSDFDMRGFDQNFADSEAGYFDAYGKFPAIPSGAAAYPVQADTSSPALFRIPTFGHYNSPSRFSEFKRELAEMLKADPKGGAVPNLILLKYSNDHTQGYRANSPKVHSPRSGVADNDYAVGQTVDLISHSVLWDSTAIFVIEDDSQDGPDHVDSHRSTCYVISPYIKKNSVDHRFYNTDSVLKTMELLLNMPPMSQYDAFASTILDFGKTPSNQAPYTAILPPRSLIEELNPSMVLLRPGTPQYHWAKLSDAMDFVHPDSAPSAVLNQIIWKSIKGAHSKMPAPRHNPAIESRLHLPKAGTKSGDDDD